MLASAPQSSVLLQYKHGSPSTQATHRWNVWLKHYGEPPKNRIVGEMVDEKAVALASSMLSETFIYSVRNSLVRPHSATAAMMA